MCPFWRSDIVQHPRIVLINRAGWATSVISPVLTGGRFPHCLLHPLLQLGPINPIDIGHLAYPNWPKLRVIDKEVPITGATIRDINVGIYYPLVSRSSDKPTRSHCDSPIDVFRAIDRSTITPAAVSSQNGNCVP